MAQRVKVIQDTQSVVRIYIGYIYCWHVYYTLVNEDKYTAFNEHVQCISFVYHKHLFYMSYVHVLYI